MFCSAPIWENSGNVVLTEVEFLNFRICVERRRRSEVLEGQLVVSEVDDLQIFLIIESCWVYVANGVVAQKKFVQVAQLEEYSSEE